MKMAVLRHMVQAYVFKGEYEGHVLTKWTGMGVQASRF